MLKVLGEANLNVADAVGEAVSEALQEGLVKGLGDAIVTVIAESVRCAVENCIGSKEMGDIVARAISDGIESSNFSK